VSSDDPERKRKGPRFPADGRARKCGTADYGANMLTALNQPHRNPFNQHLVLQPGLLQNGFQHLKESVRGIRGPGVDVENAVVILDRLRSGFRGIRAVPGWARDIGTGQAAAETVVQEFVKSR
jgi:hypothetical protein